MKVKTFFTEELEIYIVEQSLNYAEGYLVPRGGNLWQHVGTEAF